MYEELKSLEIELSKEKENLLDSFSSDFLKYNSKVNLISKKDENLLFEKHIFDSLAFNLFYKQYQKDKAIKVLDIGTGGGFPSLPTAIIFDKINITAVDSINKKINFIKFIKDKYNLENITPICSRVEDIKNNRYASATARAIVCGATIAVSFVPGVGTVIAFGIGMAVALWGQQFYDYVQDTYDNW